MTQGTALSTTGMSINTLDFTTRAGADAALAAIDTAIEDVSGFRASFGATSNCLDYIQNAISVQSENLTAANGRIRDVDVASEMACSRRTRSSSRPRPRCWRRPTPSRRRPCRCSAKESPMPMTRPGPER